MWVYSRPISFTHHFPLVSVWFSSLPQQRLSEFPPVRKSPIPSSSDNPKTRDRLHERHSRRHSLALSAVALLHGRSLKKGRHFSQSTPYVLCLQLHTSLPNSFFTHSLACPLHLHLEREGQATTGSLEGPRTTQRECAYKKPEAT